MSISKVSKQQFNEVHKNNSYCLASLPKDHFESILFYLSSEDYKNLALCSKTLLKKVKLSQNSVNIRKVHLYIQNVNRIFQINLWSTPDVLEKYLLLVNEKNNPVLFKFYATRLGSILTRELAKQNHQQKTLPRSPCIIPKVSEMGKTISTKIQLILNNEEDALSENKIEKLSVKYLQNSIFFQLHHFLASKLTKQNLHFCLTKLQWNYHIDLKNFEEANTLLLLLLENSDYTRMHFDYLTTNQGVSNALHFAKKLPKNYQEVAFQAIFQTSLQKYQFEHAWSVLLLVLPHKMDNEKINLLYEFGKTALSRKNYSFSIKAYREVQKTPYFSHKKTDLLEKIISTSIENGYTKIPFFLAMEQEPSQRKKSQIKCSLQALSKNQPQLAINYLKSYPKPCNLDPNKEKDFQDLDSIYVSLANFYYSAGDLESFWEYIGHVNNLETLDSNFQKVLNQMSYLDFTTFMTRTIELPPGEKKNVYLNLFIKHAYFRKLFMYSLRLISAYESKHKKTCELIFLARLLILDRSRKSIPITFKVLSLAVLLDHEFKESEDIFFNTLTNLCGNCVRWGDYVNLKRSLELCKTYFFDKTIDFSWANPPLKSLEEVAPYLEGLLGIHADKFREKQALRCIKIKKLLLAKTFIDRIIDLRIKNSLQGKWQTESFSSIPTSTPHQKNCNCTIL